MMKLRVTLLVLTLLAGSSLPSLAAPHGGARRPPSSGGGAQVYPQFRYRDGRVVRWIREQMPIRVYVSHGLSMDGFVEPSMGAPRTNVDNSDDWPNLVMDVMQNPEQINRLPIAPGYSEQQYQAAVQGMNSWKILEGEGLYSFQFTDNPDEADIYVFWTDHFVNKMGLALFANDIRGKTAKYLLPVPAVMQALATNPEKVKNSLKPVLILLRTTEGDGTPMPLPKMKASAAHEFGHALGIDGHSNNPIDLMSMYYGRGVISVNDLATMRQLYRLTPDLMP